MSVAIRCKFGMYVRERANAARWIFDRREKAMFWCWPVLTAHNPDRETLGLPDGTAYLIFTDLTEKGLLIPFVHTDGAEAFRLNMGKEAEWRAIIQPPGFFRRYITPAFLWVFRSTWVSIIWLVSVIVAAWIGSWFKK